MPIAASEKAALPKTDIRAVHQALDAEHRTWARKMIPARLGKGASGTSLARFTC